MRLLFSQSVKIVISLFFLSMGWASPLPAEGNKSQPVEIMGALVTPPEGTRWDITTHTTTSLTYKSLYNNTLQTLMASFMPLRKSNSLDGLEEEFREAIKNTRYTDLKIISKGIQEQSGNQCIKVSVNYLINEKLLDIKFTSVAFLYFICRDRLIPTRGILAAYSESKLEKKHEVSAPISEKGAEIADQFFQNIRITPPIGVNPLNEVKSLLDDRSEIPINSLWNDSHGAGMWLYEKNASCSTGYGASGFISTPLKNEWKDGEMHIIEITEKDKCNYRAPSIFSGCHSGLLGIRYDTKSKEFSGAYKILLENGEIHKGRFRSEYCKPFGK